jgi:hypothetical protein
VTNKASNDFWSCFDALPAAIQRQARKQYKLYRQNPNHPSLHFKELSPGLVSVRVSRNYRALGRLRAGDVITPRRGWPRAT